MRNNNSIIVGAGTYGQVYAEYLKEDYDIIGFIDDDKSIHNTEVNGIRVLGDIEYLLNEVDTDTKIFVPIGNNKVKASILEKVRAVGFQTPNYIHSSANIDKTVKLGENAVYILQGSIIMPLTTIEDDVMISAGSIISHHTIVKRGTFISFGVNVGASIVIKERSYLGIGSLIMTGVKTVGQDSLIGAGAVVIRDVEDNATVVGNPAKRIK